MRQTNVFHKLKITILIGGFCVVIGIAATNPAYADTIPDCCWVDPGLNTDKCTTYNCGSTTYTECTACDGGQDLVEQTVTVCSGRSITYTTCAIKLPGYKTCSQGFYGDGNICNPCPPNGTSNAGATKIIECYLPTGDGDTDTTGTWEYVDKCYYSD